VVSAVVSIFGIEAIQYQFWNVLIRPATQARYQVYSASRTLLLLILQYFQLIFVYATVYLNSFSSCFIGATPLMRASAFEFSVVTMTTVGFGSIAPKPGSIAGLVAASQALLGVFLLGLMVAATLSRTRAVSEVPPGSE
jgi:hypothetical protein